jgi:imidazolonepropionase-like amidohydrolase
MRNSLRLVAFLVALVASCPDAGARQRGELEELLRSSWRLRRQAQPRLALTGCNVVDVRSGEVLEEVTVLIGGDLILSISEEEPPDGARVEDVEGRYVIPGLLDLHAHIEGAARFNEQDPEEVLHALLDAGITTVRELPLTTEFAVELAARVARGSVAGPTIVPASSLFEQHPERSSMGFETPERARQWVEREALAGARWIKIYNSMDEPSLAAIVEAAHRLGLQVCGHTEGVPPLEAAMLGVDCLEHLVSVPLSCLTEGAAPPRLAGLPALIAWRWQNVDEERGRDLLEALRENGTAWVPTLVTIEGMIEQGGHDRPGVLPEETQAQLRQSVQQAARWAVEQHRRGGLVGIGTDFPVDGVAPGVSVHREIEILVEQGQATPLEALQIATLGSARVLGLEALLGSVEEGKLADLVVLDGNPLEDVGALATIHQVVRGGKTHE